MEFHPPVVVPSVLIVLAKTEQERTQLLPSSSENIVSRTDGRRVGGARPGAARAGAGREERQILSILHLHKGVERSADRRSREWVSLTTSLRIEDLGPPAKNFQLRE